MLRSKALSNKIMVLGVDGLDPRYTKKLIDAGKLPNLKKLIEQGAQREDLAVLGCCAPVTPPGWTTLSTGAYSYTHGISQFCELDLETMEKSRYSLDSRMCKAEQAWNCFAEAGKKTLVMHWPGCSWPPTSDNENLFVIDGTVPGAPGMAAFSVDTDFFFGASASVKNVEFLPAAASDTAAPCVVEKKPNQVVDDGPGMRADDFADQDSMNSASLVHDLNGGFGIRQGRFPQNYNIAKSYLRPAIDWADAPEDALEFVISLHKGLVRRHGLMLKNSDGKYDRIAIYRSKKDVEPLVVLKDKEFYRDFVDEGFVDDKKVPCSRDIYAINIAEDGSDIKLYFSTCSAINDDSVIHPKWLHNELMENVGPYPPTAQFYSQDETNQLIQILCWEHVKDWYVKTMHYMIEKEGIEIIFSHFHAVDLMVHTFVRYLKDQGYNLHSEDHIEEWMVRVYEQTDRYLGEFLHYLDEDWTIMVVSDHALVCPAHEPPAIGDMCGINIGLMEELGYTVMKEENGKRVIDWTKTRAIAEQGGNIWINLKGRTPHGIVDPKDQYELEEQIITDLYGYRHPVTGKRVIAVAVRNKDAVFFGYGGDTAGDIFTANAEGYNFDHTDGLFTNYGERGTSLAPIFIAAGKGLKKGYKTNRLIRQVDIAPTMCALAGVRFPKNCDGAPIYQILEEEL